MGRNITKKQQNTGEWKQKEAVILVNNCTCVHQHTDTVTETVM